MPPRDERVGLYVHVPFCTERCLYCDFAIVTRQEARIPDYLGALEAELAARAAVLGPRRLATIHLGGGTPSKLEGSQVARIVAAARERFPLEAGAELGLEANPEDVDARRVAGWREAGVTRVTLGLQSLRQEGLATIGRPGRLEEGRRALGLLAGAGFDSLGADLIFGRPGQELAAWEAEMDEALALPLDHLSLYALELDGNTPLVREIEAGARPAPDPDLAAAMYEAADARLRAAGFARYEVSNWARPGHESRHNTLYWTDEAYLGVGPSAASYVDGVRFSNPRRLGEWLRRAREGSLFGGEGHDPDVRFGEALVMGLRLARGVEPKRLAAKHGAEEALSRRRAAIEKALGAGLLDERGGRLALTPRGTLIAHEVFAELL